MATNRKMIHVYVTEEEKKIIEEKAAAKNTSVSKLLLELATSEPKELSAPVTISKPDRGTPKKEASVMPPPPPDDGVERGFSIHPSKKEAKNKI
jgi:hypothetical protein